MHPTGEADTRYWASSSGDIDALAPSSPAVHNLHRGPAADAVSPPASPAAVTPRPPAPVALAAQWEVQTDAGWAPWTPGVEFRGEVGEQITYTLGRFTYNASVLSPGCGVQVNASTGKQRALRCMAFQRVWEVETDQGWTVWKPGITFSGEPGEVVQYTLGRFQYTATFNSTTSGFQTNTATGKSRAIRIRKQRMV
jgi:hypothetical protein